MFILIVEDSLEIAEALKEALALAGHTARVCGTMRAAMDILDHLPVEAVIADGEIPSYDVSQPPYPWGPEITRFARGIGIKAILFSANDELVEQERQAGGKAVLKPGNGVGELLEMLEGEP